MEKDILYTVIIYKEAKILKIYKKEELICDKYCQSEQDIYQTIVFKTHECKDVDQIEIIYK